MLQINLTDRVNACVKLGDVLQNPDVDVFRSFRKEVVELHDLIANSWQQNAWFTPESVKHAVQSLGKSLNRFKIEKWFSCYPAEIFEPKDPKVIGVVMAGNIPLVAFHDYLSVLITGNKFLGKLSSNDSKLLPLIHRILIKIEPGFSGMAEFTEDKLTNFDAIIATGSNNTSRYFEFYFGKYPNIIRKNRNSVAVITGNEQPGDFVALGEDIFRYFGLGCRNVSKIYVPEDFIFDKLFESLNAYNDVIFQHKYKNNYDYNKSIYLVNSVEHFDNGFLMLKQDDGLSSPVSVVFYERYNDLDLLKFKLQNISGQIQCIVSIDKRFDNSVRPGQSQKPELWDYADGVDVVQFLMRLK